MKKNHSSLSKVIWGIVYFCTIDGFFQSGFFRILKKALSELICTRLYSLLNSQKWNLYANSAREIICLICAQKNIAKKYIFSLIRVEKFKLTPHSGYKPNEILSQQPRKSPLDLNDLGKWWVIFFQKLHFFKSWQSNEKMGCSSAFLWIFYSCNKITTTQIKIFCQNQNGFFWSISRQMMI